jgi:hypothetical protein
MLNLGQLLETLGIHDYSKLTAEEKATYEGWAKILSAPNVTVEDISKLMKSESDRAQVELEKWENPAMKRVFYQALSHFASVLKLFIDTPSAQRESLRNHLKQTFKVEI